MQSVGTEHREPKSWNVSLRETTGVLGLSGTDVYGGTDLLRTSLQRNTPEQASVCQREQAMQKLAAGQKAEGKSLCCAQPQVGHLYHTPPKAQGPSQRKRPKDCNSQRLGKKEQGTNSVFRSWQHQSARELTFACTTPVQDQANLHSSTGRGPRAPSLRTDGGREPVFFKGVACDKPHSPVGGPRSRSNIDSTNQSRIIYYNYTHTHTHTQSGGRKVVVDLEGVR